MCERCIGQLPLSCPQLGTWPATQACAPIGNQTGDLLVHRLALNPLSHTSQGQTTSFSFCELHSDMWSVDGVTGSQGVSVVWELAQSDGSVLPDGVLEKEETYREVAGSPDAHQLDPQCMQFNFSNFTCP